MSETETKKEIQDTEEKENINCPDCESSNIDKLDGIRRHCQECGRVFNLNQLKK